LLRSKKPTFFDFGSRILGAKSVKTDVAVRKSVVKPTTTKDNPQITLIFADYFKNEINNVKTISENLRNLRIIT
jgi:hypothetical protein